MLKKGDRVSITTRKGFDAQGNPIMETLDWCEVEEYSGGMLTVNYRAVGTDEQGKEVLEIRSMVVNVNSPDFVGFGLPK